jgi:hypothetical protein
MAYLVAQGIGENTVLRLVLNILNILKRSEYSLCVRYRKQIAYCCSLILNLNLTFNKLLNILLMFL